MPGTLECSRLPHADSHTSKRHIPISFRRSECCSMCNRPCTDNRCNGLSERATTCPYRCAASSKPADIPFPPAGVPASMQQLSFLRPLALTLPLTEEIVMGWSGPGILISLLLFEVLSIAFLALHLKLRTAVDWNACTCDPARSIGCQKSDYVRDVFGLADSLKRLHAERDAAACLGFREVRHVRLNHSGRNGVDANAASAQQRRPVPDQCFKRSFGCGHRPAMTGRPPDPGRRAKHAPRARL